MKNPPDFLKNQNSFHFRLITHLGVKPFDQFRQTFLSSQAFVQRGQWTGWIGIIHNALILVRTSKGANFLMLHIRV